MGGFRKFEVKTIELAEVLGITQRRVNQLTKAGVFECLCRDKYRLSDAVQKYLHYRVTQLTKQFNQTADIAIAAANVKKAEYARLTERTEELNVALFLKLQSELGWTDEADSTLSGFDVDIEQFMKDIESLDIDE